MYDDELDRFKRDIPLLRYAVECYGYERDKLESSRSSHVLRHPGTNDKIIVRPNPDGHWTYFSVRDDRDNGTIVDFVLSRMRCGSFGRVRQELRQWLGTPRPERDDWTTLVDPPPVRDPRAVAEAFDAAHVASTCDYLEGRGLSPETLSDPRFAGTWRLAARGNVLFAHRDDAGQLTGFEIKNRGFTGFSTGGIKTAWQSASNIDDRALVIAESAIDALSYHQLQGDPACRSRYLSTAGTPSARQVTLLERLFADLPPGFVVVAAVDQDPAGTKLATELERLASLHAHLSFRRDSPTTEKDWNDVLKRIERAGIHSIPGFRRLP